MKDMAAAVTRIQAAIAGGERIAVYADFDVDGLCSAVLLMQTLASLGAQVQVYIPHRVEEGYGLNVTAISRLAGEGVHMLISADCGTSSVREVAHANSLGMDVIITDHHHVHGPLPAALALLNPHRPDCPYPFKDLAGVGVAYRLACALLTLAGRDAHAHLDLVALGTVVDVAPLVGENRALVQMGLAALRQSPRPGLRALMAQARIRPEEVDTGSMGFALGPRLNAAGRMASAMVSYDLLVSASVEDATPLAKILEQQNQERRDLLEAALATARGEAAEQVKSAPLVFVASDHYRAGIVGLVAGRLAEEFYRPSVAVEQGEAVSRGSCRSIPGFHIARALDECDDLLIRHGGHAQAAGFTIATERLPALHARLAEVAQRDLGAHDLQQVVAVDCRLPLRDATWKTLRALARLAPFGIGNPTPALRSDNVRVKRISAPKNVHLRLSLTDGGVTYDAIAFRQAALIEEIKADDRVDVVYNLEESNWNGEEKLQLVVKDLRKSSDRPLG
jgi:single-stranded-DNA-specific exonuclease